MQTSQRGLELIKNAESFRAYPYLCPANVWTQGYGHTRDVKPTSLPVTVAQAEVWLAADVKQYEQSVKTLIKVPLTQGQFDALVSFTFNLGGGALQRSTLRSKLNRGDYEGAANELLKWVRGGGRILSGLVKRRAAERELFLSDYSA